MLSMLHLRAAPQRLCSVLAAQPARLISSRAAVKRPVAPYVGQTHLAVCPQLVRQLPSIQQRRYVAAGAAGAGAAGAQPGSVTIDVEGMMCDGCSSRIENVLKGMTDTVAAVSVSLEGKTASVTLAKQGDAATAKAVVDAINELGFEAKLRS